MDAEASGYCFQDALQLPFRSRPSHLDPLYHPLRSDNRDIRLLQIDHSQPDEVDIHCSFKIVSLNSAPAYQALSYEWGPPDIGLPSSRVFVNLHNVPTTPNLRRALKHLERGTSYWIDAICIDQSHDKERGHQVRLMTEIYRHAVAVVVWLGPERRDSAAGMSLLKEVGALIDAGAMDPEMEVGWERIRDDLRIEMVEDVALNHVGSAERNKYFQGAREGNAIAPGLDLQMFLVVDEDCIRSVLDTDGGEVPYVLAQDVEYGQLEEEEEEEDDGESYPGFFKVSIDSLLSSLYVGLQGMGMAPKELWPFADPIFEGTDFF